MSKNTKVVIHLGRKTVRIDSKEVDLTPLEINTLTYLAINKSAWHKNMEVMKRIWENEHRTPRVVDQIINKIRKKVTHDIIISAPTKGYKFNEDYAISIVGRAQVPGSDGEALDEKGQYRLIQNRATKVQVLDMFAFNGVKYVIFTNGGRYQFDTSTDFFINYEREHEVVA
jgi:DNA-binding winged helix-turn-helix (wHTH) protein